MKITDDQATPRPLADLGARAVQLLCAGDFSALAQQFGYALAYDRDPATAIREELALSLAEIGASALGSPPNALPSVSYFEPNDTGLFALVEQRIPADGNGHVLLELVVSAQGSDKHVVLEQVCAAAKQFVQAEPASRVGSTQALGATGVRRERRERDPQPRGHLDDGDEGW